MSLFLSVIFASCTLLNIGETNCALKYALYNHEYILEVERVTGERFMRHPATGEMIDTRQVVVYRIRYTSDDYEVMGYVAAPADFTETAYPILIFNRGGNNFPGFKVGMLDATRVGYHAFRGYIVLASQYRGAVIGMRGMEQLGGDDINDVLNLITISESFHFAKQGGVFMFGGSRGGMMTYIAVRMDDRIKAAASFAGVSNMFDLHSERNPGMQHMITRLVGGTPEEVPEEYERRSAVFWADEITVPLLIGHGGESDSQVLTGHSINLAEALERYGRLHRLIIYPDVGHYTPSKFLDEMDEWFRKHSNFEETAD